MNILINTTLGKSLLVLMLSFFTASVAVAQDGGEKQKKVSEWVNNGQFIFKAQSAQPMRGRSVQLTSEYDVRLAGDTLQTYLPYFGRAYSAAAYTGEGGIKITSTDFNYSVTNKKRNRYSIVIEPKDAAGVQQLILSVSKNGYANLQVISTNREPISFNGYIAGLP